MPRQSMITRAGIHNRDGTEEGRWKGVPMSNQPKSNQIRDGMYPGAAGHVIVKHEEPTEGASWCWLSDGHRICVSCMRALLCAVQETMPVQYVSRYFDAYPDAPCVCSP